MGKHLSKKKREAKQLLRQHKLFTQALVKLHERLTIILDHNLRNKLDPCETDVSLIKDLYRWYDTSSLDFTEMYDDQSEDYEQMTIVAAKKTENQ